MITRDDALAAATDYGDPELAEAVLRRLEARLSRHADATKLCRSCGVERPLAEFPADPRNADGLDGRCRSCDASRKRSERRSRRQSAKRPG